MFTILVVQEDRASVHATLGDVQGNTGQFESRLAWHPASVA